METPLLPPPRLFRILCRILSSSLEPRDVSPSPPSRPLPLDRGEPPQTGPPSLPLPNRLISLMVLHASSRRPRESPRRLVEPLLAKTGVAMGEDGGPPVVDHVTGADITASPPRHETVTVSGIPPPHTHPRSTVPLSLTSPPVASRIPPCFTGPRPLLPRRVTGRCPFPSPQPSETE